jgi:flagellar L-ring protein precursor FlgH
MDSVMNRSFSLLLCCFLCGCAQKGVRLYDGSDAPPLTRTQDPTAYPDYQPVHMPMPEPSNILYKPNALWRAGSRTFFKDQRANRIGDILTVLVDVKDNAEMKTGVSTDRTSTNAASITGLFGYENKLRDILPKTLNPNNVLGFSNQPKTESNGEMKRGETVKFSVAVTVIQILPNGNLVISGRQEMRVDFEVRDLAITGVVRPEDISSQNTVDLKKIAEARISYGGRGQLSDLKDTPYGQKFINQIMPF